MSRTTGKAKGMAAKRRHLEEERGSREYPQTRTPDQWRALKAKQKADDRRQAERAAARQARREAEPRPTIGALRQRLAGKQFTAVTAGYNMQGQGVPSDQL